MWEQSWVAFRLLCSIALNALGLAALLAVAWYLPQLLGALVRDGALPG